MRKGESVKKFVIYMGGVAFGHADSLERAEVLKAEMEKLFIAHVYIVEEFVYGEV